MIRFTGVFLTPTALFLLAADDEPEEDRQKRAYACLATLAMPAEGLDEHLESTIDQLNYYREMAALPPSPPKLGPVQFTAEYAGITPGPEFIVSE